MLTKVLAIEIARHKVRVNAIGPGFIETPMTASMRADEQRKQAIVNSVPLGRLGQPEDIANAVSFFCSEASGFVNGQVLYVAGGPKA